MTRFGGLSGGAVDAFCFDLQQAGLHSNPSWISFCSLFFVICLRLFSFHTLPLSCHQLTKTCKNDCMHSTRKTDGKSAFHSFALHTAPSSQPGGQLIGIHSNVWDVKQNNRRGLICFLDACLGVWV